MEEDMETQDTEKDAAVDEGMDAGEGERTCPSCSHPHAQGAACDCGCSD